MAPQSVSPANSISSHTLSAQSLQSTNMDRPSPASAEALLSALSTTPHTFLQPQAFLHTSALSLAKRYLDPLASAVSQAQAQRLGEARKKRKRDEAAELDGQILRLKAVHLDGFGVDQVWEQARRVLDAAVKELEGSIPKAGDDAPALKSALVNGVNGKASRGKLVQFEDEDSEEDLSEDESGEEGSEAFSEEEDESIEESEEEDEDEDDMDGLDELEEDVSGSGSDEDESEPAESFVEDQFGLNDGFFSIDDFNKKTEFLEHQDARGDPNDGGASDEEEVDWDADPLSGATSVTRKNVEEEDDDEEEDEEDGPTFGDMDLDAAEGASGDEMDDASVDEEDMGGMGNTNNVMYADFFAPPPKKGGKKKKGRPNPHNFPPKQPNGVTEKVDDEEIERTMSAVHRDLFDDSDPGDSEDPLSDVDAADPRSRRSTHERRQAKLAEEIRQLEAANVAKREWVMSGEARAAERPVNSLLEENLDFERAGKPVPVITAEVSEDIESLIKRRILAQEFDEVIRRRPDDLATGPAKRGRFELDDTKATKGLGELYEEEHLRKTDPNYVDVKDEKLKKEHNEIEALWKSVSGKLDSLSSWHYKPKPPVANLEVRVDAPAITMEDARPTAGGEVSTSGMLAPQEVYTPGQEKQKGEVVTRAGLPVSKEEMTREQKLRRRRREKERSKKTAGNNTKTKSEGGKSSKDKSQVVSELKKGGVKVIGAKGEIRDATGALVKDTQVKISGGQFKL